MTRGYIFYLKVTGRIVLLIPNQTDRVGPVALAAFMK